MNYPTLDQVAAADHIQLARWHRFLPSPGSSAIGERNQLAFDTALAKECAIMDAIEIRFHELGGMIPELSRCIG